MKIFNSVIIILKKICFKICKSISLLKEND